MKHHSTNSSSRVRRAQLEADIARAKFDQSLIEASQASAQTVRKAWSVTRPALIGTALLLGAATTVAVVILVRSTHKRRPLIIIKPVMKLPSADAYRTPRSRAVLGLLARALAKRAVRRLALRLAARAAAAGDGSAPADDAPVGNAD